MTNVIGTFKKARPFWEEAAKYNNSTILAFSQINRPLKEVIKLSLHPKNLHRTPYPYDDLIVASPPLALYLIKKKDGEFSIDFTNSEAVKELNRALLIHYYKVEFWDIPDGYLCPPIPGRADYIHHVAGLLKVPDQRIPRHPGIVCLDVGVGANCVYPIIARAAYNWSCIGSDIDELALEHAKYLVDSNTLLKGRVDIRKQAHENFIFKGILSRDEFIDLTVCNPPFHASKEEAIKGTNRKNKNLSSLGKNRTGLNFGGRAHELWYTGGEFTFISRMIEESQLYSDHVYWFTTLVSKEKHLKSLNSKLVNSGVTEVVILPMSQGQKQSRILAWTYFGSKQRRAWEQMRWLK